MAQIASAAHEPYKSGALNTHRMQQLTDLAWQADQGNKEAANKIDWLLEDPTELNERIDYPRKSF
ncbi:MAG: hypothetical protein U5K69_13090 [Balneolaceae bacterium]|nr:hypothetical protein [Balneolaceae bacterium]